MLSLFLNNESFQLKLSQICHKQEKLKDIVGNKIIVKNIITTTNCDCAKGTQSYHQYQFIQKYNWIIHS